MKFVHDSVLNKSGHTFEIVVNRDKEVEILEKQYSTEEACQWVAENVHEDVIDDALKFINRYTRRITND